MEVAMPNSATSLGLASPCDSIRVAEMAQDKGVSPVTFAAPESSHEDEDTKESDRWRLQSDTSTISSRVTTPDPVVPSPRPNFFTSISNRIFLRHTTSNTIPSDPPSPSRSFPARAMERLRGRGYSRGRGRGRILPKGPIAAARRRPSPIGSPQHDPHFTSISGVNLNELPPPLPTKPPPFNPDKATQDDVQHGHRPYPPPDLHPPALHRPVLHPPAVHPPAFHSPALHPRAIPPTSLGPSSRDGIEEKLDKSEHGPFPQSSQSSINTSPRVHLTPRKPSHMTRPPPSKFRRGSKQSQTLRRRSDESESESLTFSLTRSDASLTGSSSSEVDPIAYRNARQFPPQLPAGPIYGASVPRSRSSATNQIAAWVSQYEKRSPVRLAEIAAGNNRPTDTNSHHGGSMLSQSSSHGEVEILWQQLKEKRVKLNHTKAEMRSRRKEMREKRRQKDDADNAFMTVVRPILVDQGGLLRSSTRLLESRLENMQRLRDDYQVLESSYENLELMMDDEERDLSILETRFFSLLAAGQTREQKPPHEPDDHGTVTPAVDLTMPFELRGISPSGPKEELHPLYVELSDAIGDLGNAREEYMDLLSTKEQFEEGMELQMTTRQRVLDEDDVKEFFDEFPSEELRMRHAIQHIEGQVQGLKKRCEEKGVMRKHMTITMAYALNPDLKYEDMDLEERDSILARKQSLAHPEFSELISQPDHVLADPEPLTPFGALKAATRLPNNHPEKGLKKRLAVKELAIDNLMRNYDGETKTDYVNRWLLHQLRLSPLNATLLRSTFQASRSLKIRDMWRWQCDVIHYWWRDNTMPATTGPAQNPVASDISDYSSRLGTPQMSRAASDGIPRATRQQPHMPSSNDAKTVHG